METDAATIARHQVIIETYSFYLTACRHALQYAHNGQAYELQEKINIAETLLKNEKLEVASLAYGAFWATCKHFNISESTLKGKNRKTPLPLARQLFCYISMADEKKTEAETARRINQIPSTAHHNFYLIDDYKTIYPHISRHLREIRDLIQQAKNLA